MISVVRLYTMLQYLRGKKGSQNIANKSTDSVHGKNVESIVATEEVLEFRGIVACYTSADTEDHSSPSGNVSGPGGDGNQARNDTGAESDCRPLALKTVINQAPGDATNTGCEIRDDCRHDGAEIGGESGTGVEPKPTNPEEYGANDNVGNIVGTVVQFLSAVTPSFSKHVRVSERSRARGNMHGGSSSKIEATHLEDPSRGVPRPAGERVVDERRPTEHIDDARQNPSSFSDGANSECNTGGSVKIIVQCQSEY